MNPVVNTLVVVSLVISLVLIATKHQFASLTSTTFAAMLIILSIPREACECDDSNITHASMEPVSMESMMKRAPMEPVKRAPMEPVKRAPPRVVLAKPPPAHTNVALAKSSEPIKPQRAELTKPTEVQMLPACNDPPTPPEPHQMKDYIRNHGMYGVHGNLSCKMMQRSATADSGLLQPLNARNQMIKFLAADQLHAKDPHLISRKRSEQ